jgi:hypothetical protein
MIQRRASIDEAFTARYGSAESGEAVRFKSRVADLRLPFDFEANLSRFDYPGYPSFETGLPSAFRYFVPGALHGSHRPYPEQVLDSGFVAVSDGDGLNFGNPFALDLALSVLATLSPADQAEPLEGLRAPSKHLAAVEELVTVAMWPMNASVCRPKKLKVGKNFDWVIECENLHFNVESKFRPVTWALIVDGPEFQLMPGVFAGDADSQLPPIVPESINIVAVSGLAPMTDSLAQLIGEELAKATRVQVIVYRDLVGQRHVTSLDRNLAVEVNRRLMPWATDKLGRYFCNVIWNRSQQSARSQARTRLPRPRRRTNYTPPHILEARCIHTPTTLAIPSIPYRSDLVGRLPSGEPLFECIVPYL